MIPIVLTAVMFAASPTGPGRGEAEVRLLVRPMSAPSPAMRYRLLPSVGELTPGNAAHDYLRCFAEQRPFFFGKDAVADRARYRRMSLLDLRLEAPSLYRGTLSRADWAARMQTVDWQALPRIREVGLEALPAELGSLQILAESVHLRFRGEVADQRFDDAIRSAQTMLAMGRHLGEHPTEVGGLIAMGVAHLGLDALREMVQQPRCPNLYWALTDLPSPLIDLHRPVQGEQIRVEAQWRPLRGDAPMTGSELESLVGRLAGASSFAREQAGLPPTSLRTRLRSLAEDASRVEAARRRLREGGAAPAPLDRFPPLQVILLDERREYEILRDERLKLLNLPAWRIDDRDEEPDREGVLADFLPGIVRLRRSQAALDQQVALLRHVEALRLYADGHDGRLPSKLGEVPVPLPDDPVTGRPFSYEVEGTSAHLRGGSPRRSRSEVHYVVTLLK